MLQKIENFGRAFFYFGLAVMVWLVIIWGINSYRGIAPHVGNKALAFWLDTFSR